MGDVSRDYEQHVERRARVIYEADPESGYDIERPEEHWRSDRYLPEVWETWLKIARDTMDADRAAGYALVPREATEAMALATGTLVYADVIRKRLNSAIDKGDILGGKDGN